VNVVTNRLSALWAERCAVCMSVVGGLVRSRKSIVPRIIVARRALGLQRVTVVVIVPHVLSPGCKGLSNSARTCERDRVRRILETH